MLSLVTTLAALVGVHARRSVALLCVWVTLLIANLASAEVGVQAKTRVWDFGQSAPLNACSFSPASAEQHREIRSSSRQLATESLLAARGGAGLRPMFRSLGAAGDDLLLKKAVNSNLPHAIERGVERGVFGSADEAGSALRSLSEQITKSGTFPTGTLVDTARSGRFLVPVGDGGMAVYQLGSNGTAKLKTVLIAR